MTEVRLTAFKTFHDAVLPLTPLTLLIGRDSSGKSNALDALEVLSRLAQGEDIRDALDSRRRDAGPVRGGLEGCPPHGEDVFTLGCTVSTPWSLPATLDVTIQVRPDIRIVHEQLSGADHRGVVVCDRDPATGAGRLRPLPELAGYAAAMAEGKLGDVVTRGILDAAESPRDYSDFDRLLGIG
ncbi:hypothetical protein [Kitasatospora sp. NPDC092286]|uniref:hypothetical protein n=1 Tax=Kitasatospora sp. NPDC092286 TaxID=3364087 RepID=UPI00382D55BB